MFDRFVVVDWSAQSTPKLGRDSIWIGVHTAGTGEVSVTNLATRSAAEAFLVELFESDPTSSTLVGVDFSLGYPAGTAAALGLTGTAWSAMWALLADQIRDDDRNGNNRFAVAAALNQRLSGGAAPFWGCPPSAACASLAPTKPTDTGTLAQFRATEQQLRAEGRRPFSSWQLLGAGAVGSQSMLGIGRLQGLRIRFGDRLDVWPFTTGFGRPALGDGAIVVAEVWPSMLAIDDAGDMVRDAAQVRATVRWLTTTDESGGLDALFSPALAPTVSAAAVAEEGWVLGVVA
jgi:precorrin-8X/cobalt-precorrin-8 methylmutase